MTQNDEGSLSITMAGLSQAQKTIVGASLGPIVVTAGAGSGKTRVLTCRLAHLIQACGIVDSCILALTFTNKAAGEMKKRVDEMLGFSCKAFLGTFHSFCARFLRKNIGSPFTKDFSIYSAVDTQKVLKEIVASKEDVKNAQWHISNFKNGGDCSLYDNEKWRVIELYNERLRQSNALDFDDLLYMTLQLLEKDAELLSQMQQRFQYILVDEFQDTNLVQYKIVALLAKKHRNIMVVGDEDQCIYTWRGASIKNLDLFLKEFEGAKIYKLEENFRSSKNIVSVANKLVAHNSNRLDKVLYSSIPEGKIDVLRCFDEREEAMKIAETIALSGRFGDFAILMRINALSRVIEEQLLAYNIPHVVWGGFKFYERAEIKSVINYLRVLVNPRDEVALLDVINFPRRGIGEASIEKLRTLGVSEADGVYAVVSNIDAYHTEFTKRTVDGIKSFFTVIEMLRQMNESFGLFELAGSFISVIGLEAAFDKSKEEGMSRLENIYQLENAIKVFASENPNANLSQYLQSVSLVSDNDVTGEEKDGLRSDAVVISTVHSAKGLEFRHVFIVGAEDGIFPLSRARNSEAEMEEERRLLYVAITRARERLSISYCGSRFIQGERRASVPSLFLRQAGFEVKGREEFFHGGESFYAGARSGGRGDGGSYLSRGGNRSDGGIYSRGGARANTDKFHSDEVTGIAVKSDTAESLELAVGQRVRHEKFGDGTVADIIDKNIVKIQFDIVGVKMLSLAFAVLEKI